MSRQTKLNAEIQTKIVALVEAGDRPEVAAGVHGVGRRTYYDWMQRAETGEEPYASFRTAVTRALDVFESESRRVILGGDDQGVGFGPSKARLEVLSRRMPRKWAQQVRHHVETVEDEFLSALEEVCRDPHVHERVRTEKDCRFVFLAFCEALSRRESEGETPGAEAERSDTMH